MRFLKLGLILLSLAVTSVASSAYAEETDLWPGYTVRIPDNLDQIGKWNFLIENFSDFIVNNRPDFINHFRTEIQDPSDDYSKKNHVALYYIEMTALDNHIENNDEEALKDFLALRQYRTKKVLNDHDKAFEIQTDIGGGMTEYVASKGIHLNELDVARKIRRCTLNPSPYDHGNAREKFTLNYVKDCVQTASPEFAAVIAGYKLDQMNPQWKTEVEQQFQSAVQLLQLHYPKLNEQELNQRIESIKIRYDYPKLLRSLPEELPN